MTNSKTHMTTGTIWLRAIVSLLIVVVVLWALFHVNPDKYPESTLWIKSFHGLRGEWAKNRAISLVNGLDNMVSG